MALDTVFVRKSSYVFSVRNELYYWSDYGTLRDTTGDKNSGRLMITVTVKLTSSRWVVWLYTGTEICR